MAGLEGAGRYSHHAAFDGHLLCGDGTRPLRTDPRSRDYSWKELKEARRRALQSALCHWKAHSTCATSVTNHTGNLERLLALRLSTQSALGVVSERASALVPEVRRPLLNADPDYLNAALEQIESMHGTIERFLSRELDVGRRELDKLADLLLV